MLLNHKVFILWVLLSSFVTLHAKDYYVQVMSTKKSKSVQAATKKLNALGYEVYTAQRKTWRIIYAGPFESRQKAKLALRVIHKRYAKDAVLVTLSPAAKKPKPKKPVPPKAVQKVVKDYYVQVLSTSDAGILPKAIKRLHALGYDVYTLQRKKWHVVFVGPFKYRRNAISARQKVRKRYAKDAVIVSLSSSVKKTRYKKPAFTEPEAPAPKQVPRRKKAVKTSKQAVKTVSPPSPSAVSKVKRRVTKPDGYDWFIGASAGYSTINVEQKDISGSMVLLAEPDASAVAYGVEGGYNINGSFFITLNYQKTDFTAIEYDDAFMTLNYRYDGLPVVAPYLGALVGYSKLSWKQNPIDGLPAENSLTSLMYGLQVGSEFSVMNHLLIYAAYQVFSMDHSAMLNNITDTTTESAKLEYNTKHNVNVGVRFAF